MICNLLAVQVERQAIAVSQLGQPDRRGRQGELRVDHEDAVAADQYADGAALAFEGVELVGDPVRLDHHGAEVGRPWPALHRRRRRALREQRRCQQHEQDDPHEPGRCVLEHGL
jgi:hypothetical protein